MAPHVTAAPMLPTRRLVMDAGTDLSFARLGPLTTGIHVDIVWPMGRIPIRHGKWTRRTYRIAASSRAYLEAVAARHHTSLESAARVAIRRYVSAHGAELERWEPVVVVRSTTYATEVPQDDAQMPRIYLNLRPSWMVTMEAICSGEVRSVAGVVRESCRAMEAEDQSVVDAAFAAELSALKTPRGVV